MEEARRMQAQGRLLNQQRFQASRPPVAQYGGAGPPQGQNSAAQFSQQQQQQQQQPDGKQLTQSESGALSSFGESLMASGEDSGPPSQTPSVIRGSVPPGNYDFLRGYIASPYDPSSYFA